MDKFLVYIKIHVLVAIMLLTLMQLQHVTGQMLVITF